MAVVRGYHDYMAEKYCAAAPDRLIGVGVLPNVGADEDIAEVGVFDRFPALRICWAETNIGWIPYYYQQMDNECERNHYWAERLLAPKPLARRPSEYLREHAYWGFCNDPIGVRLRHEVGVDRIMWSTDFPHAVTQWPNSLAVMEEQMAGVPEDERYVMVAGNAICFFKLDNLAD